jgi:hypothetical protein
MSNEDVRYTEGAAPTTGVRRDPSTDPDNLENALENPDGNLEDLRYPRDLRDLRES